MVQKEGFREKDRNLRIPPSQVKQIKQVIEGRGDFKSVAEYVRYSIREQLKRDAGGNK